ncbi:hypothetical protein KA531_00550, partial [Candidatus Saccharibacteria bacterium]|nr:hypothetical protein [Candidatus Saccharibacteria bacterium]
FKTYQFENNPNGKMLLSILFATSKQYSEYNLMADLEKVPSGRVEHTLHELLKCLLEDYHNTVSVLEELRIACKPKLNSAKLNLKVLL